MSTPKEPRDMWLIIDQKKDQISGTALVFYMEPIHGALKGLATHVREVHPPVQREEWLEKAAETYRDEDFKLNPDGYTVSQYCNTDTTLNAFEAGARQAFAVADAEILNLKTDLQSTKQILEACTITRDQKDETISELVEALEYLQKFFPQHPEDPAFHHNQHVDIPYVIEQALQKAKAK